MHRDECEHGTRDTRRTGMCSTRREQTCACQFLVVATIVVAPTAIEAVRCAVGALAVGTHV